MLLCRAQLRQYKGRTGLLVSLLAEGAP
jgi:hypothetical protein